jgi:hypothetical protein
MDVREEGFDLICSSDIPTSSCSFGAEESVFKDILKGVNFKGKWRSEASGAKIVWEARKPKALLILMVEMIENRLQVKKIWRRAQEADCGSRSGCFQGNSPGCELRSHP